jgi:hypothetical protein
MITYELAKQLKDAGFPLNPHRDWDKSDFAWLPCNEITKQDREKLWIPSLSELIKACGDGFIKLVYQKDNYGNHYMTYKLNSNGSCQVFSCLTPEEAVAKLWLELNK